jgi:hypothetical protein
MVVTAPLPSRPGNVPEVSPTVTVSPYRFMSRGAYSNSAESVAPPIDGKVAAIFTTVRVSFAIQ